MGEVQLKVSELYEPGHTLAWSYLEKVTYPWEILKSIKDIILAIGPTLDP